MASRPPQRTRRAGAALESDDVLGQIFLHLESPNDLVRACAASLTFRRIIMDPRFLGRFRALRPPPLLGIFSTKFLPAEPPHPSAAAARAFTAAAGTFTFDFLCSFLPDFGQWGFADARDGRTLLAEIPDGSRLQMACRIAVCDPLHRRYRMLPANGLVDLIGHEENVMCIDLFLAPSAEDGDDMPLVAPSRGDHDHGNDVLAPPFRVMYLALCATKLVLFVFSSSAGGQWRAVEFDGWRIALDDSQRLPQLRQHVNGRFCWAIDPANNKKNKQVLVLDVRRSTPKLSSVKFPPRPRQSPLSFVDASVIEGGEACRLGVFIIHKRSRHHVYYLRYAVLRAGEDGDGGGEWEPEAIIYLPLHYQDYKFIGVAGGYLLLEGTSLRYYCRTIGPKIACFSLDVRTLQLEWFCGNTYSFKLARLYARFPPYLSPSTV